MHSQKMIKVLGAGLTAAALTLGAAAPALAEVTFDEPVFIFADSSDQVIKTSDSGDTLEIRVPMTSTSDKEAGSASFSGVYVDIVGVDEWGNTSSKKFDSSKVSFRFLKSNGTDLAASDKASDVRFLSLSLSGSDLNDLADGFYSVKEIGAKEAGAKKATTFEPEESPAFELKSGAPARPVTIKLDTLKINEDSVDIDGENNPTNIVSISASGATGDVSGAIFTYETPSGEELSVGQSGGFSVSSGVVKVTIDLKNALNGYYTLKSIRVLDGTNYVEVTSDTDDLSAGDFTVTGGADTTVYRLYNPNSSEHFYTVKSGEKDLLVEAGWKYEGVAFETLSESDSGAVEVFRVYNPNGGDHHFTMSEGERDLLVAAGWRNEGVAFYSAGSTKSGSNERVYRVYNPNAETGSHHYTLSSGEKDLLVSAGWNDEGTAWFAAKKASTPA